jgi:hypothetical protein
VGQGIDKVKIVKIPSNFLAYLHNPSHSFKIVNPLIAPVAPFAYGNANKP